MWGSVQRKCRSCAVLSTALAAGCVPHIGLQQPQIALPATYSTTSSAPLAPPTASPIDRWWIEFRDPQLTELVEAALSRSTDVRLALATLREARAIRRNAFAQTLPGGTVSGSITRQYTKRLASNAPVIDLGGVGAGSGSDAGGGDLADLFNPTGAIDSFSIDAAPRWEIDLFGRLTGTRAQARAGFAAAYLDYEAVRLSLAADVANTLFEARGYAAQREDALATLRIAKALADSARLGASRGLTAGSDVDRLDTDVANAEAEIARVGGLIDTSRRSLLVLAGRPSAPLASLPIAAVLGTPPDLPAATPSSLLRRRPDVQAAELRLIAASAQVRVDRAALFPRLTLQPGVTLSGSNSPLGATNLIWQLGAGLTLPILNRPALFAKLRITAAQGEQAVIRYEQAVQTAFRESENALIGVTADRARQAALTRAAKSARLAFEAKETGFRLGLNDLTTLLQAENAWRTARNALTAQQTGSLQNTVTAFKVLGGGWTPAPDAAAAGLMLTAARTHR